MRALSCIFNAWSAVGNDTCQFGAVDLSAAVCCDMLMCYVADQFCAHGMLFIVLTVIMLSCTHYNSKSFSSLFHIDFKDSSFSSALRPLTHASEIGAITSMPHSGTRHEKLVLESGVEFRPMSPVSGFWSMYQRP